MPTCCSVMKQMMQSVDRVVAQPPNGLGASLRIEYVLPRHEDGTGQTDTDVEQPQKWVVSSYSKRMLDWQQFETHARFHMARFFGSALTERQPYGFPKRFDLVSPDAQIIGDAKFLTLVHGVNTPPAKFMEIAGHVWLLEHTSARRKFLVFGNQREVAERWLKKYGAVQTTVEFYFLDEFGNITDLRTSTVVKSA